MKAADCFCMPLPLWMWAANQHPNPYIHCAGGRRYSAASRNYSIFDNVHAAGSAGNRAEIRNRTVGGLAHGGLGNAEAGPGPAPV